MKDLQIILSQSPVFLNQWSSPFQVIADFEDVSLCEEDYNDSHFGSNKLNEYQMKDAIKMTQALLKHAKEHILFASYSYADYSGDAWVLFEKDGKLYEVNGGHCSCYGLEGQWEPEEVNLKEIENRIRGKEWGKDDNNFREELMKFLGVNEE